MSTSEQAQTDQQPGAESADAATRAVAWRPPAGRRTRAGRAWGAAARRVAADPVAGGVFVLVLVLGLLVYRVWLPIPSVAMSIALALAFAVVFALQAHTIRSTVRAHRSGTGRHGVLGGVAFVASCLPCFVGLTPTVPALLAAFGTSAAATSAATQSARHALMGVMPILLAASLALLVLVAAYSYARLATDHARAHAATSATHRSAAD